MGAGPRLMSVDPLAAWARPRAKGTRSGAKGARTLASMTRFRVKGVEALASMTRIRPSGSGASSMGTRTPSKRLDTLGERAGALSTGVRSRTKGTRFRVKGARSRSGRGHSLHKDGGPRAARRDHLASGAVLARSSWSHLPSRPATTTFDACDASRWRSSTSQVATIAPPDRSATATTNASTASSEPTPAAPRS